MGSAAGKNNASLGISVYQNPIVEHMTFGKVAPVAGKIVGAATFQGTARVPGTGWDT
jgi:hypothetical protein